MSYCDTSLNIHPTIEAGFPGKDLAVQVMRHVFRDRANGVGLQDNILQTPSAIFIAPVPALFLSRKKVVRAEGLEPSWAV